MQEVQYEAGVAAIADKIVQKAVTETILTPIYEAEFLGFSYGFRRGRGAHDALDALAVGLERRKINWVVDCDIRAFFDTVSRDWMVRFLEHRIGDRRVIRLIIKWLNAGVMEAGEWRDNLRGTPQGSVISPVLANIYLHPPGADRTVGRVDGRRLPARPFTSGEPVPPTHSVRAVSVVRLKGRGIVRGPPDGRCVVDGRPCGRGGVGQFPRTGSRFDRLSRLDSRAAILQTGRRLAAPRGVSDGRSVRGPGPVEEPWPEGTGS